MPDARPTYRQQQAQMTKDRIVEAARRLMAERGWTPSTIDAIAEEAGVATATVYAAFGNKRALLDAMRHAMRRDSKIPELMAEAANERSVKRRLELWAQLIRQQMETSYDVIAIHRDAARSDPAAAEAYRVVLDSRAQTFTRFIHDLRTDLAAGIDERTATDLLWAFSNEEIWRELTAERGWSPDRYEQWLARTLIAQLVTAPAADRTPSRRRQTRDDTSPHGPPR
ncbi:MAG: TetR/AcrR family transcriptional regulator [Dehalococcoidia bacterium]